MRSITVEHKTIEDAIAHGLTQMDLSLEEVSVEVLEEGAKGLFGLIGAKPAKVRLTERAQQDDAAPPAKPAPSPEPRPAPTPRPAPAPAERPARPVQAARPVRQETGIESPRRANPQSAVESMAATQGVPAEPGAAGEFVLGVAERMGMDVTVTAAIHDETLRIEIMGDDKGILIGHRGETLDALQYLSSLVHNKNKEPYERIQVDSQNYRRKREETLVRLANRLADKATRTRRRVALEPMNPYERRILHSALQNNPGVTTFSEGEEPNRRVVIQPR